ncbi:3-(3-hydroxy-phenyl)propionate/3-hydroxycinnamic acid hydroxylase [Marinobacterium zhoushanense]|uniref:3-(3-hydroxy-phenyl)propionate/3-hydroxycinnamic acid hydroxylase n=1 Tax=Marinobacterium zhoushanense TaxID=1679163 RepID=A0ABQ1K4W3_9GAMM|nr:3-(3-hydroxy-phenyl)propionate/3-hydroxycinnamic acid hydroxylase [Marinobacterium zhoushanense]
MSANNEKKSVSGRQHVPVVVVGAGPNGLTLANLLGTYGVQTVVLEKNLTTVQLPRAVSIDDESMRTMQMIGLDQEVIGQCALDYGSVYLDVKRRPFARIEPTASEYGFARRNAFIQPDLEASLKQGLRRFECVDARFGHEVVNFSQDEQGVLLEVEDNEGNRYELTADYVAASDGGKSYFRTTLDIPLEGLTYEQKWLIIDLKGTRDNFRQTRVYCDPRRPGINLPGPDGTRRFEFMMLPGETEEEVVEEAFVRRLMADHGPDRDAEIVRKQVYHFHAREAVRWREGRIFLVGDAAHLTPPFAGQGMNSGIRDASNLGWKLAHVVHGQLPATILDSYEDERKPHAWQLIEMAAILGRFMMPPTMFQARLMQAGMRLLSLYPPARDYVTQMRYKPKPRFTSGWFLSDGLSAKKTRSGRMIAQPALEDPQRHVAKLDGCCAPGFLLLGYGTSVKEAFSPLKGWEQQLPSHIQRVCITPQQYNPVPDGDVRVFRDAFGKAREWIFDGVENALFLVRPDRYVMAVITEENAATVIPELKQMLREAERGERRGGATQSAA